MAKLGMVINPRGNCDVNTCSFITTNNDIKQTVTIQPDIK